MKSRPLFRYTTEARVFEDDGMDYINMMFGGDDFDKVLKVTRRYAKNELGGKVKINVLENRTLYDTPCIYSKTYTYKEIGK